MRKYAIKTGTEVTPPIGVIFFNQLQEYAIIKWTGEINLDSGWMVFDGEDSNTRITEYISENLTE